MKKKITIVIISLLIIITLATIPSIKTESKEALHHKVINR